MGPRSAKAQCRLQDLERIANDQDVGIHPADSKTPCACNYHRHHQIMVHGMHLYGVPHITAYIMMAVFWKSPCQLSVGSSLLSSAVSRLVSPRHRCLISCGMQQMMSAAFTIVCMVHSCKQCTEGGCPVIAHHDYYVILQYNCNLGSKRGSPEAGQGFVY